MESLIIRKIKVGKLKKLIILDKKSQNNEDYGNTDNNEEESTNSDYGINELKTTARPPNRGRNSGNKNTNSPKHPYGREEYEDFIKS